MQTAHLTSVMLLYGMVNSQYMACLHRLWQDITSSLRCNAVIMTCLCRERGRSGSSSGGLGGAGGGGQSELQLQRQRLIARRKALQKKLSEVNTAEDQTGNNCIGVAQFPLLGGPKWKALTAMQLPASRLCLAVGLLCLAVGLLCLADGRPCLLLLHACSG